MDAAREPTEERAPGERESVFAHRPYAFYWAARVAGTMGLQMITVAVGWQVYSITRQPLDLGLIGLVQFIPAVGLALPAGHVVDLLDRRHVALACISAELLASVFLGLYALSGPTATWPIYLAIFAFGTAYAFHAPANAALMPNLVPPRLFANAVAWSSSGFQAATIIGPAAGGLLYAFGAPVVYATVAGLLAIAFCLILAVRPPVRPPRTRKPFSADQVFAGLRFIWSRPIVLGAISLDLFAVLLGGATALLPAIAADVLQVGPWALGVLRSAPALGALVVGIWLARHPLRKHVGRIMFVAVAIFGLATIAFGLSTNLYLSVAALVVLGASDMVSVVIRQTLVQLATPDEMRGRVSSVNFIFIGTSNQLGEFESGITAHWLGVVPAIVLGGLGTLVVVAIWMWRFPDLRRARSLDPAEHR
jgi:MFS family permease